MAYYAALVSVVQLLKEINHPQHPYPNSLPPKNHQIHASLYEKFNLVQGLLENYSRKDHLEEYTDILEGRIRDAAYRAQNIIESQISNLIPRLNGIHLQKVMEEVDLIVEELRRITPESHEAHRDDLRQKSTNISEDCGLVPLVQLLEKISHHDQYPKTLLHGGQIASLLENFKLLQEAVQKEQPAGLLERRIGDVADRTHDIIETHISNKKRGVIPLNILAKEYRDLKKVKDEVGSILKEIMRIKMEKVSIDRNNLWGTDFSASSSGASTQAPQIDSVGAPKLQDRSGRSTTVVLDESLITTIKGQICGERSSRAVISIVGMGGLGKTTLARYIFDGKLIHERFDCRAWVTASQDYHQRNILLAIVDSLDMEMKKELKEAEVGVLMEQIYKHLKGRRYIIVVDDVWETKVWDDLNRIFPNDNNGSRVITTTRLLNVAVYADNNSGFIHELQFLNEDQSWNLFHKKVFCPTELENIGRLIAKNCRGLPLAIVVVAGILSKVNKTRRDWEEIVRDVSSATIGQNDEHFSKILSLSYNHLPHHLKPCFLYLGVFPEDYNIRVSELIWMWIGEGLLQPIADKSLEEVGEEYLKDLVKRNLVLITEKKSCGKIKKCSIHDLLRELCFQKACSERFFHCLHKEEDFNREPMGDVHRLSVHMWRGSLSHIFKVKYISHVRSVLFFPGDSDLLNFLSTASGFKLLRVLDTISSPNFKFPEVVGDPLHLRYVAFRRPGIIFSPSMFRLQNLQTLIVPSASLPSEIWKMPQLRHVKGIRLWFPPIPYYEIRIIHGVPLLGNLQTLGTIKDFIFTRDTVEMIPNLKKLKVTYTNVECDRNWEESQLYNLAHLRQLEVLSIEFLNPQYNKSLLPENFAFPSTLIKLTLICCELSWKDMRFVGSLPNLHVLKLKRKSFIGEEWEPAEGEFPKLRSLLMEGLFDLKYWRAEDIHFPCLKKLRISICPNLLEIPLGIGDISTLQCIVVDDCNSAVRLSALKIQEDQQDLGNYHLQVHVVRRPSGFARISDVKLHELLNLVHWK